MGYFVWQGSGRKGAEVDLIPPAPSRGGAFRSARPTHPVAIDAEFIEIGRAVPGETSRRYREVPRTPPAARDLPVRPVRPEQGDEERADSAAAWRSRGFWSAVAVLSLASFWYSGGHALAGRLVGGGSLTIAALETRVVADKDRRILVVSGRIENRTREERALLPLVVDTGTQRGLAVVSLDREMLAPGDATRFEARLEQSDDPRARIRVSFARSAEQIVAR